MRVFLLLLFTMLSFSLLAQQEKTANDTATLVVRGLRVNAYKKLPAFQYEKVVSTPISLWDKFWNWFWHWVDEILSTSAGKTTFNTVLIILGLLVLSFFVFKVVQARKGGVFARKEIGLAYEMSEENIHSIDYDKAIDAAIAAAEWQLAIRLLFLQSLKLLSDAQKIEWQINKTNSQYIAELKNTPLQQSFAYLSRLFDYAWYGQNQLTETEFADAQQQFIQFQKAI